MGWVADYTHRIDPSALKAAGVVGVCRYLSYPVPSGKVIERPEYNELRSHGIDVVLNWEFSATDWLGGASSGRSHGTEAARQAKALGHPPGSAIPGSADFDMTAGQWAGSCRAYAVAFRDALHSAGYAAGVYGPWDVLSRCRNLGGFSMFWQAGMSTAWSGRRNANAWLGAHLRQRYHQTVGGQDVDHNDILITDWQGGETVGAADDDAPFINARIEAIANLSDTLVESRSPLGAQQVAFVKAIKAIQAQTAATAAGLSDLKAAVANLATGGVDLEALATTLAPKVAALLPKPPTADEIAERIAARLGNG